MSGVMYGYARVSTRGQKEDRQMAALQEFGVAAEHITVEKQSGKNFDRPLYQALAQALRTGDVLVVQSIDRLGRNYQEIMEQWRVITKEKKVDIRILDMPLLDTTRTKDLLGTFISDVVLQLLSFVAENERNNIRQRQAEGIAAAKARGIRFGKPKIPMPDNFQELYQQWEMDYISTEDFAALCHVGRSTLYKRIREYRELIHFED